MDFLLSAVTDKGVKKAVNQDAVTLKTAGYKNQKIAFAVLCDGMGGLEQGELASTTVINRFSSWFSTEFPKILKNGYTHGAVKEDWQKILLELNASLIEYGKAVHGNLGTTFVAVLIVDNRYIVANVGDSRAYMLDSDIYQITKDQSVVAREIAMGRLTEAEAETDSRKNILLQCVGATGNIEPDFFEGTIGEKNVIMLCSDGFRHKISKQEIYEYLRPDSLLSNEQAEQNIRKLTEINRQRGETDDITAVLIKVI